MFCYFMFLWFYDFELLRISRLIDGAEGVSVGGFFIIISIKESRFLEKLDRIKLCRGTENCLLRLERDCRYLCVYI